MGEFVKQKVNPVIDATPYLRRTVRTGESKSDSLEVKKFSKSLAFFRGIFTPANRKTLTADIYFLDEADDMLAEHMKEVRDRTRASEIQQEVKLGVPSVEDYGINAAFKESTQNYWTMDCGCGREWVVEESWPHCVSDEGLKGHLKCPECGAWAYIQDGRWKARNPDSDIPGYTFNGAMNPNANLKAELEDYNTGKNRHIWVRGFLGQPAAQDSGKRMTSAQIEAQCCKVENGGGYVQFLSSPEDEPCGMGIDTGASDRTRRVYIARTDDKGLTRIIKLFRYTDLEDIAEKVRLFHVNQGVIDAGGEPTLAIELVQMFPRIFFRCRFQRGVLVPDWNEKTGILTVDRVSALDASREALYSGTVLPSIDDEDVKIFCDENGALVKKETVTPKGTIYEYVSHGPDHGGLTWTYTHLALTRDFKESTAKAVGTQSGNQKLDTVLRRRGIIR